MNPRVGVETSRSKLIVTYGLMAAVTVALFLVIRSFGEDLAAPAAAAVSAVRDGSAAAPGDGLVRVLVALITVIAVSRLLSAVFAISTSRP